MFMKQAERSCGVRGVRVPYRVWREWQGGGTVFQLISFRQQAPLDGKRATSKLPSKCSRALCEAPHMSFSCTACQEELLSWGFVSEMHAEVQYPLLL